MEIRELKLLLSRSWKRETCSPILRNEWNEENTSLGQCAITDLIVNDIFGGEIMRCMSSTVSHYYNLIEGKIVDLTVEQFRGVIPDYDNSEERTREYLLSNKDTESRYLLLKNSLQKNIEEESKIKQDKYKICVNQRTQLMSEDFSKDFRNHLKLCSSQLYFDEKDRKVKQRKKKF